MPINEKLAEKLGRRERQPVGGDPDEAAQAAKDAPTVPRFDEWLERDIPKPDLLCGTWLSTTSRVLITGPTGLGKTMLGVALAIATGSAAEFMHWDAGREARILYIDGEMSRREMQRRLRDEAKRSGLHPKNLFVLSKEDFDEMPPLNTEAGQAWMNVKIDEVKPELIIFDNIQALVAGDQRDEESWTPVLPWIGQLTKRHVGQIWLHHTGHNEGHSYGTKTREWKMDTAILMKRVNDTESDDLTFSLEFTKARERTPENREEFANVTFTLRNDRWEIAKGSADKRASRMSPTQQLAYEALVSLAASSGELLPAMGVRAVSVLAFKTELLARGVIDGANVHARFTEISLALKAKHRAAERDGRIWPILKKGEK
jgi:hypothetical protein